MGLVRLACWPEFKMSIMDVVAVLDHLRDDQSTPVEWMRDPGGIQGLSEGGQAILVRLSTVLTGLDQTSSPWTVLATLLLDRTRIAARIADSTEIAERMRGIAVWQLLNFVRVQPSGNGLPIVRLLDRVRRLVRLGDDRDLRQLPIAAQGIDAVRLMTIHGAKGLEFPVIHVPGMNAGTLPRTPPAPPCPPLDGMVEGGEGSALELFRAEQAEEQECLFYVALSRARDRLFIYAPTQKSNGNRWPLSPFLDRLGSGLVRQHVSPARQLPIAPDNRDIPLAVKGAMEFSAPQIALYQSCPRRFFYTHLLQVGGRRTATAFMQMHEAVRAVFEAVIADDKPISDEHLEAKVADACAAHGLAEHGYANDYQALALAMVRYFVSTRNGHRPEPPTALSVAFGGERIIVRPDDVLIGPDGVRTLRRVQTGHYREAEGKDVGAAAFLLAARQAFPDARVELVYLSDQETRPLTLSSRMLQTRQRKISSFLEKIRLGGFPANPSPRTCPVCPAFYICGPTPLGTIVKNF